MGEKWWDMAYSTICMHRDYKLRNASSRLNKKFQTLCNGNKNDVDKLKSNVVNLSSITLDEDSHNVLEYGLNFVVALRRIPTRI